MSRRRARLPAAIEQRSSAACPGASRSGLVGRLVRQHTANLLSVGDADEYYVANWVDITQRKRATAALERPEITAT